MASKYTYSVSVDFTGLSHSEPNIGRLSTEIDNSTIGVALDFIDLYDDTCDIWFVSVLGGAEQTTLDGYVASHDGRPGAAPHTVDPDAYADSSNGYAVGDSWINDATQMSFVCLDDSDDAAVWKVSSLPDHYTTECNTLFGTTNTDYENATSLTTGALPAAQYKIQWSFEALTDSGTVVHSYRMILDDGADGYYILAEQDLEFDNPSIIVPVSGFANKVLTQGQHIVCLNIKSFDGLSEVQVRRRRIDLRRIQ